MKPIFKSEDFIGFYAAPEQSMADFCNEKINKLIEAMPVVYSYGKLGHSSWDWYKDLPNDHQLKTTHQARLAFIEETVKEPCNPHKPISWKYVDGYKGPELTCEKCGVELIVEYREKK